MSGGYGDHTALIPCKKIVMNTCKMSKKVVIANYKQKEELYFFMRLKALNYKKESGFCNPCFYERR